MCFCFKDALCNFYVRFAIRSPPRRYYCFVWNVTQYDIKLIYLHGDVVLILFPRHKQAWSCVFLFHSHMFNTQTNLQIQAEFFSQTENTLFHLVMSSCGDTGSAPLCF
ncbi:hypothetical protein NQD34_001476 [Periophthalmus magnuspinnatus]|nr:hypothetical protein NQD34_001476 [Periophthalmus magnuspinnatus]